ncbi:MAG: hypothetical protein EBR88_02255 [Betaproteobacteria bacterium]|nr:hypothetical protein [Betaproteobacteria bacterium]
MKFTYLPRYEVHDDQGLVRRFDTKDEAQRFTRTDQSLVLKRTQQQSRQRQLHNFLRSIPDALY